MRSDEDSGEDNAMTTRQRRDGDGVLACDRGLRQLDLKANSGDVMQR